MSLEQLAEEIHRELMHVVRDLWMMQPAPPAWATHVVSPSSVLQVLQLAEATSLQLGVAPGAFQSVGAAELAAYWAIAMRQEFGAETLRSAVIPNEFMIQVAKAVASSVFSMHQQATRYRNFLMAGPPPGVQQFPEYTGSERTKSIAVDWGWRTTAAQPVRTRQYDSCTASQPRRAQSLRSQQCVPSDVTHPSLFV